MDRGLLSGSCAGMDKMYKDTTLPIKKTHGRVKKILHFGSTARRKLLPLFEQVYEVSVAAEAIRRQEKRMSRPMSLATAEETALLGVMPLEMDDIELRNFHLQFPSSRRMSGEGGYTETRVHTDRGDIVVAVQGDRGKPAIITYHDLGLNYLSFQSFFNFVDMRALVENFCVYHVNAPGQEEGAPSLPEDYIYPTMDELANQLNYVVGHFGIKSFIGFGVGAGANILARFALLHPSKVDGLVLVNCTSSQAGWLEWVYQKLNTRALRSRGMTQPVLDYLMWYHFGRGVNERSQDLTQMYRVYFSRHVNAVNLSMFIDAYICRSDLSISRDTFTLKIPVLNITGAMSPHVDETVTFNGRLNPQRCTWMKISDCAMVLDEQPGKIAEAFRLFLQGEGYVAPLSPTKIVAFQRLSDGGLVRRRACAPSPVIRITENPISEAVVC